MGLGILLGMLVLMLRLVLLIQMITRIIPFQPMARGRLAYLVALAGMVE